MSRIISIRCIGAKRETDNKENDKLAHKVAITTLAIVFLGIIIASIVQNHKQTSLTPWVSNDTFSFDIYNSYTFNHYNAYEDDDYEFDCYKLSSKVISEISKNPPQYFIYNQKTLHLQHCLCKIKGDYIYDRR